MEDLKNLTEKDYKEFFKWILERDVELDKELDYTLSSTLNDPYVFYPKEIGAFLQTRPMQRLKKIEQLGTSILINPDACHTRYAHCLGTYHNATVFYLLQFQNSEWRKRIEDEGRKIEVLADIIEALRHDDGHNILSHGLERLLGHEKGTHELVGARYKDELPETIEALNNIHPDLISTMRKVSNVKYDLITLREGNLDFDRLDFISRDSLYLGLPDARILSYELLRKSNIVSFPTSGRPREMIIYDYDALPCIEKFIETRAYLYKKLVSSNDRKSLDLLEEEFCRMFVDIDTDVNTGVRLKQYLEHCRNSSATTMDLEEFLSWNDLKYYNELIDIAMNDDDENLRDIAIACLPTKEGLCNLAIEMLNPRHTDPSTYTEEDLKFLRNVKAILDSNHPLNERLGEDKVKLSLSVLNANNRGEVEEVLNNLRRKGISEEELQAITTWDEIIKKYNFGETIFIRDKNGNVFPLEHHPELSIDLSNIHVSGALILPAKMRRLGIPEEKIELMQKEFEEFNASQPMQKVQYERRMRKFKTGETPYVPEYMGEREIGE